MTRHIVIAVTLVTLFAALTCFAASSSAGSSFQHKVNATVFAAASIGLMLVAAMSAAIFWRRALQYRNYSLLIVALSCLMFVGLTYYRANQSARVVRTLETTYHSLANAGSPFPVENRVRAKYLSDLPNSYSTGYWVSPDRQSFEMYYHDSSDSYTMKYPNGTWEWRGDNYSGPVK